MAEQKAGNWQLLVSKVSNSFDSVAKQFFNDDFKICF